MPDTGDTTVIVYALLSPLFVEWMNEKQQKRLPDKKIANEKALGRKPFSDQLIPTIPGLRLFREEACHWKRRRKKHRNTGPVSQ